MDFAPFIMGFPIGMEGELSFLVPPGVTEIGVLAVGAAGGDNPVYNIADDFLISTVAGGSGDCVVVSPISVTPGEVLRLVLGSDGRVPQYENTSHQNEDNIAHLPGDRRRRPRLRIRRRRRQRRRLGRLRLERRRNGTAILRGATPLVVGGGGGAGGFGDSAQPGGLGGSAGGSGGAARGSSGGGGGQGAAWGSGQGQPGGSPGGIDMGGGGGGGWNGGSGGGHGGSDGGGGGGAGSGPPHLARHVELAAPQGVWKLVIWSPPDPQPTDHLFTLPF